MQTHFVGLNRNRKQESDSYCWSCHKREPELFCSTCVRSFHISSQCSSSKGLSAEQRETWRCSECLDIDKGVEQLKALKVDQPHLKESLNFMFELLVGNETLAASFMNIEYPRGMVVNTMDFSTIGKKIEISAYGSCEDFWADVKWIVHNTRSHCTKNNAIIKAAKSLNFIMKEELFGLQLCYECYVKLDSDWFVSACESPHLLIWAKQRTYPHWPAKLMRYNSGTNTVDIRYFGQDHYRAVLPVKNCLLFSEQNPSTTIGSHRKALEESQKEAEEYIANLIKRFGAFNYAQPMSEVHVQQLERHLYDMVPNAWKELGKSVVPPPIAKPMPAQATSKRRMSVPVQQMKRQTPDFSAGRVMTRRMSVIIDESSKQLPLIDTNETTKKTLICRRQSVQLDSLPSQGRLPKKMVSPNETMKMKVQECKISVDKMCKEPDLPINLTNSDTSSKTSTKTSDKFFKQPEDDSVFKVPDVPPKAKKRFLDMPSLDEPELKISCPSEHSPEIVALCNAVVEKNLQKMSTVIRSSLSNTLFDFVETSKPDKQVRDLQEQMEQQKRYYEQLIDAWRGQNRDLKSKNNKLALKCESLVLNENDQKLTPKMVELTDELKKAQEKNSTLESNLNTASTENAFLSTTITKMQKTNIELTNRLKKVDAKNGQLHSVNVNLTDGNTKLATNISKLTMDNRNLVKKVIEAEKKCDSVKNEEWDQCAKTITNPKKQQWCDNCRKKNWFPGRL